MIRQLWKRRTGPAGPHALAVSDSLPPCSGSCSELLARDDRIRQLEELLREAESRCEQHQHTIERLQHTVELKDRTIDELQQGNGALLAKVRQLAHDLYAPKSERSRPRDASSSDENPPRQQPVADEKACDSPNGPGQQQDGQEEGVDQPAVQEPSSRPRGGQPGHPGHGRKLPAEHLPVIERIHGLPEDQAKCDRCGAGFIDTGKTVDSEQIDVRVEVGRIIDRRKVYEPTCDCETARVCAPVPPKLVPRAKFTVGFLSHVLIQKFHVPYQRQIRLLGMEGLDVCAGTLINYAKKAFEMLFPLYELHMAAFRQSKRWMLDETRWRMMLDSFEADDHSPTWWLWVGKTDRVVLYLLDPSRSHEVVYQLLGKDARGWLNSDRYSAYKALQKLLAIVLVYCWAHMRRDFVKLSRRHGSSTDPHQWARKAIDDIGAVYRCYDRRKRLFAAGVATDSPEYQAADKELRQAVACVEQIWVQALKKPEDPRFTPDMVKVAKSLKEHWHGLTRFVDHPILPIDNNEVERLGREAVIDRKVSYGSHSQWGGQLLAVAHTILQTCDLHGVNPREFLQFYLQACAESGDRQHGAQPPEDLQRFLPWNLRAWVPRAVAERLFLAEGTAPSC